MFIKFSLKTISFMAVIAIAPVHAGLITASGAGALIGTEEDLTGTTPTEIVGTLPSVIDPTGLLTVNLFKLNIDNFQNFSVMSVAGAFGIGDTELFLFDSMGRGVYANDDMGGGGANSTLACLPSALNNPCLSALPSGVGPMSDGVYYLAISLSSDMPLSDSGEIFTLISSTDVVGPDPTMGGADPLSGWDGGAFAGSGTGSDLVNYDIVLTGTTPEPATWSMMGMAGLGLVLLRRKISRC